MDEELRKKIIEHLKTVYDPEIPVDIYELGLIYKLDSDNDNNVKIDMTMTSPACPAGPQLIGQSKQVVSQMDGIGEVEIKIVMDPPWTPDRMTDDARDQLGIF